jgi:hypothetical protein
MPRPLLIPAALVMFAAGAVACTEQAGTDRAATDTLPAGAGAVRDTSAAADGVTTATAADSGCAPAPLADSAAGPVRLGMTVEELRTRCAGTRDSTGLAEEGLPARTLLVPVGADTVAARIVEGRAWRLAVTSRGLRTRDSLGVGTPLATLLALPGAHGLVGEGRTFVVANRPCGLSFELSAGVRGGGTARADSAALRRLPAGTVVRRVLVTGCGS